MSLSSRQVGNKNEERVCWYYHHKGYTPWVPTWGGRGHGRFRSTDILGVFDVMAVSDKDMVFAQVKTGDGFRKAIEKQIIECVLPDNVHKEYWLFKSNGKIAVRRYVGDKYVEFDVEC